MGKTTLENIAPDLQILICTLLHPTDILVLRKTCKALQRATRRRIVWITALRHICLENTLFLPIHDMSNKELEHATVAPTRWIELSKRPRSKSGPLSSGKIRIIEVTQAIPDSMFFLVPGGRYLVIFGPKDIALWDLGYNSCSDITLLASIAAVGDDYEPIQCCVQATSDGKGLVLLTTLVNGNISVFDIYPQTKEPQFNQLTHLGSIDNETGPYCVFPENCIIWFDAHHTSGDENIFRVWDYKKNLSKSWSFVGLEPQMPIVTKTAVALICGKEILIWHIFPLTTRGRPPHASQNHIIPDLSPNIRVKIPDKYTKDLYIRPFAPPSRWYFGSSQPLYIDLWTSRGRLHLFKLEINPQLTDASLHLINTFKVEPCSYCNIARAEPFMVCGDTLVYLFYYISYYCGGLYSGTRIPVANGLQSVNMDVMTSIASHTSLCPASGRLVYPAMDQDYELTIHDLLPDTSVG